MYSIPSSCCFNKKTGLYFAIHNTINTASVVVLTSSMTDGDKDRATGYETAPPPQDHSGEFRSTRAYCQPRLKFVSNIQPPKRFKLAFSTHESWQLQRRFCNACCLIRFSITFSHAESSFAHDLSYIFNFTEDIPPCF